MVGGEREGEGEGVHGWVDGEDDEDDDDVGMVVGRRGGVAAVVWGWEEGWRKKGGKETAIGTLDSGGYQFKISHTF